MATSRTQTNSPSVVQAETQTKKQNLSAEVQKDLVRGVSPLELDQLWRDLEKNQDISYSYAEEEELDSLDEMDDEEMMDSGDFSPMADEDAFDEFDGEESEDDSSNVFFLNVTIDAGGKAHCSAPDFDTYLSSTPLTKLGNNCLQELSSRSETLRKLAKWLEDNRQNFLKSRKIADLGENAWEECQRGEVPICQEKCEGKAYKAKSLADVLEVPGSTFGKHIKNAMLKWEGIIVSLEILFCKEAHEAWAVSVYKNMPDMSQDNLKFLEIISGVPAETIKEKARN